MSYDGRRVTFCRVVSAPCGLKQTFKSHTMHHHLLLAFQCQSLRSSSHRSLDLVSGVCACVYACMCADARMAHMRESAYLGCESVQWERVSVASSVHAQLHTFVERSICKLPIHGVVRVRVRHSQTTPSITSDQSFPSYRPASLPHLGTSSTQFHSPIARSPLKTCGQIVNES